MAKERVIFIFPALFQKEHHDTLVQEGKKEVDSQSPSKQTTHVFRPPPQVRQTNFFSIQ